MIEPPFALNLITFVVDLPVAPSVNDIWQWTPKGLATSKKYKSWKLEADVIAAPQLRGHKPIMGPFEALVYVDRNRTKADLDNISTKALLDWAQSRCLIGNDRRLETCSFKWTDNQWAPEGCRLTLRELAQ